MSTVVCLGGYGQFGFTAARFLAERPDVDRIVLAGRSPEKARAAAARLGPKATGLQVDVDDPASLEAGLRGASVVAATLWRANERQDPIIRAAAAAGAHYVDLSGRAPDDDVGRTAGAAGIAAITGAGSSPGVTNLVARTAAHALDDVEGLLTVMVWPRLLDAWEDLYDAYIALPGGLKRGPEGRRLYAALTAPDRDPQDLLEVVRDARVVPFWLTLLADPSGWVETVPAARSGAIHHVRPREAGIDMPSLDGGYLRVRPLLTEIGGNDTPRLSGVPVQSANLSGFSQVFDDALLGAAERLRDGAEPLALTEETQDRLAGDVASYLLPPRELAALPAYAAVAVGRTGGRVTRSSATIAPFAFEPANFLALTAAAQALTVGYLLDGTIAERGVHRFEEVVTLDARFEREYTALLPAAPDDRALFERRLDHP